MLRVYLLRNTVLSLLMYVPHTGNRTNRRARFRRPDECPADEGPQMFPKSCYYEQETGLEADVLDVF